MIAGCVIKDPQTTLSDLPFYQPYDELLVLEWDYPPQKARERNKENSRAWFSTDRVPCHVPATVDDKAYQVGSPIRPTEGPLPRTAVTFPSGGPCAKSCRNRCRDALLRYALLTRPCASVIRPTISSDWQGYCTAQIPANMGSECRC